MTPSTSPQPEERDGGLTTETENRTALLCVDGARNQHEFSVSVPHGYEHTLNREARKRADASYPDCAPHRFEARLEQRVVGPWLPADPDEVPS